LIVTMACSSVIRCIASSAKNVRYNNFINPTINNISKRLFSNSSILNNRKFTEKHEWVSLVEDKAKIGITDYAQDSLGDIVYAQLPQLGDKFSQGEECGALESVKAASEIYSPVSGTVTAVNADVEEQPGLINKHPYDEGWLFELELSKPEELDAMLDEDKYNEFCKSEE